MTAKSADQVLGFEYDWLASDVDGHVALFSTAGGGYAPNEFLRDTAEHDAAIELILALKACGFRFDSDSDSGGTRTAFRAAGQCSGGTRTAFRSTRTGLSARS